MKTTLIFLFIFFSVGLFGQESTVAIEIPEYNVLYRGYSNKVRIAVTNHQLKDIRLEGKNLNIKSTEEKNSFILEPTGKNRKAELFVFRIKKKDTTLIRIIEYDVLYMPEPTFYWGKYSEGELVNSKYLKLFALYSSEIPLKASFSILEWEMQLDSNTVRSKGSSLKKAEDLLKNVEKPSIAYFKIIWKGPDGVLKTKKIHWKVDLWDKSSDEGIPRLIKCE